MLRHKIYLKHSIFKWQYSIPIQQAQVVAID